MSSFSTFITLTLTFVSLITAQFIADPLNPPSPYSSSDPNAASPQRNLISQFPSFVNFAGGASDNTKNFDALVANGYVSCIDTLGTGEAFACPQARGGTIPWSLNCNGLKNAAGSDFVNGQCPYVYQRSGARGDPNQGSYGEIFLRVPVDTYRAGTVFNIRAFVSQQFEANTNETHFIYADFYRGPYNEANFLDYGYFVSSRTNNATTFLFRDVIMAEPAASYPAYTAINHNRPLPTGVSFFILHFGVSSGPLVGGQPRPHPTSIFDVKMYARPLAAGPTVIAFYEGPTPARQNARIYFSTSQCITTNNFTSAVGLSIQRTGSVSIVGTPTVTLANANANQLYALDLVFPTGVTGTVIISMPANTIYNEFGIGNQASNILTVPVLTQIPTLQILSPQYPVFPASQQSRSIDYTFQYDTDVYGFDISRIGICRTLFQNDTCAPSDYKFVTAGTNQWDFGAAGNATGLFNTDAVNFKQIYTLNLTNVPDGTYRVRVLRTDVISGASENLAADVFGRAPIRIDNILPNVVITPIAPVGNALGTAVNADNLIVFTLSFDEIIKHPLTATQFNVAGGTINVITPVSGTEPNSAAPSNTWCASLTTATPCKSVYTVQVNHAGVGNVRSTITLTYIPGGSTAQTIVDLAGNALNSTGTAFPVGFQSGSILFSNTPVAVTITPLGADLFSNQFQVSGVDKTNKLTVSYTFTFDYAVQSFDAEASRLAGKLVTTATQGGLPATVAVTWSATEKLSNTTFRANITYPANTPTTTLTTQLQASAVNDIAGNANTASNAHALVVDSKVPVCNSVTYPAGQDRFPSTHTNLTNKASLVYTFNFDEPINPTAGNALTASFNNYFSRTPFGTFGFVVSGSQITATYTAAVVYDNGLNLQPRLNNVTDVFSNTASTPFNPLCTPVFFQFDYTAPTLSYINNNTQFARNTTTGVLFTSSRFTAPITAQSTVVVSFQFDEFVDLTQAKVLYQLEKKDLSLVNANAQITAFQPYNCDSTNTGFCKNFNITVQSEDTSYSIVRIDPAQASAVTDLAGNAVSNPGLNSTFLTDQTPPTVNLSTIYPFLDPSFRSNRQLVAIDLVFSEHISLYPGFMYGNCSNSTLAITLTPSPLIFQGTDQTARTVFQALFNVSNADLMTCQFTIGPQAVFDIVGNTLTRNYTVFVSTRFAAPNAIIYSPRGWLTNDLNPIPFCIKFDTAVNVTGFGGPGGLVPATFNVTQNGTVPYIFDGILGFSIPTRNRTFDNNTLTYCADIIPTRDTTDIRITLPIGSLRDIYNNTNVQVFSLQIRRFDLNPYTYENLVLDGIIQNVKLANGSVNGRTIQDGSIEQRHLANVSIGTPQLIPGSVTRPIIAPGAVGPDQIAPNTINSTHLQNNSVTNNAIIDGAITNTKLANNSITSDKIVDGSILTQDLANGSITNPKLAADAVATINIINGSITTEKILINSIVAALLANNSIENRDIPDRSIFGYKLVNEAIGSFELGNSSVLRRHLTNSSVDSAVIVDKSIVQADLADNSVGANQLQNLSVNTRHIVPGAVTTVEILDQTIIQADLAVNSVGTPQLINAAVDSNKLANLSVATRHIQPDAVTITEIRDNAVSSGEIVDGSIQQVDLANNSVGTQNIIPASVTFLNMANNSIDEFNLRDSSVTTRALRNESITTPKILPGAIVNSVIANNSLNTTQIQDSGVTEVNIANSSISNRVIQDLAISTNKIQSAAVTNRLIASDAINTTQIQVAGVTEPNLANNSVSSRTIIPQAVTTREIADQTITAEKLGNSSVTYRSIQNRSIDSTKIIPGSITTESLAPNVVATLNYQNGSILNQFIALNSINSTQLQNKSVTTFNLDDEAIQTPQLGPKVVTGEKIAFGTIGLVHISSSFTNYLQSIAEAIDIPRTVDGFYLANYTVAGNRLINKTVSTQQLGDAAVTEAKIAQNAVTWRQIAPQTINSDNLGNQSVLSRVIGAGQINPSHLSADFFTGATLTALSQSIAGTIQGLTNENIAANSLDGAHVLKANSVTTDQLADASIQLRKLSSKAFSSLLDMYQRVAILETQLNALLTSVDSRCLKNVTFTVPTAPAVNLQNAFSTPMHTSSAAEHTESTSSSSSSDAAIMNIHPAVIAEAQRRAAAGEHAFQTRQVTPGSPQTYPRYIQQGNNYCEDGNAVYNNGTGTDHTADVLSAATNMTPSTLIIAIMSVIVAIFHL